MKRSRFTETQIVKILKEAEVQAITEDWLEEYNAIRPHEALGDVPPYQYALKHP